MSNKYNAVKTTIDGIKFDSKKEAKYYLYLKDKLEKGEIYNLELQKKYILQPAFVCDNKKYREISYIADFDYYDKDTHKHHTVDVKGKILDVFKIKSKMFAYKFNYAIEIV